MRPRRSAITTIIVAALAAAAAAQAQAGLTGQWQGETPNGMSVVLDLKATDTTLTGTLTRNGEPSTITEGKVTKNTFTFKAVLGEQMEAFTGEVEGDQINIWLDRTGRERTVVLKRVKK